MTIDLSQDKKVVKWDDLDYDGLVALSTEINTPLAKGLSKLPIVSTFASDQQRRIRGAIENEYLNTTDPVKIANLSTMYEENQPSGFLGGIFGNKEKLSLAATVAANNSRIY